MADGVCALGERDLDDALCDHGTGEGGTEKVIALVDRAGFHGGEYVILNEFLVEVLNIELGCACLYRFFLKTVKLGTLTYVAGNGDDLAVVIVFFKPRNNYRCVKTAGVSQNDLLDFTFIHFFVSCNIQMICIIIRLNITFVNPFRNKKQKNFNFPYLHSKMTGCATLPFHEAGQPNDVYNIMNIQK